MFKKYVALLLSLVLMVSFAGCGGKALEQQVKALEVVVSQLEKERDRLVEDNQEILESVEEKVDQAVDKIKKGALADAEKALEQAEKNLKRREDEIKKLQEDMEKIQKELTQAKEKLEQKEEVSESSLTVEVLNSPYPVAAKHIQVQFTNNTKEELTYGDYYRLEKKTDSGWEKLPLEIDVPDEHWTLAPGEQQKREFSLWQKEYEYTAGSYRIVFVSMPEAEQALPFELT